MANTEDRYQAMLARDRKRMTLAELRELEKKLRAAADKFAEAIKYERTSAKHPVALKHEDAAEVLLDEAILYFAAIRARVDAE